ncbi:hypothetical protein [Hyphomicrobium sp. CS1GBMeth3]|uniref:hypothetical protein n=1 Tax=Hyphomicrobium sp. CS1GBMeth3 TaxID=1892845 RepID=UPI0009302C52|nr:hypothetical protein [Hyphomicrobium sp. CS1GBMeth3]
MSHIGSEIGERQDRSPAFWLLHIGLPAALLTAALAAGYAGGAVKQIVLDSNTSIQETVTGALTVAAALIVAFALARPAQPLDWKLKVWLALFVAAMIFFAGEDLNWGQYYFDRTPSDYFLENNREQESNLHNMWPLLFNRLPRAIIELWLVIACILVPLGWRFPVRLTQSFVPDVLWPDRRLVFAAVLVVVTRMIRQTSSLVTNPDNWLLLMRHSEVEELMIACCLFLYALMLRERLVTSP